MPKLAILVRLTMTVLLSMGDENENDPGVVSAGDGASTPTVESRFAL
jgi:hypothetical protein